MRTCQHCKQGLKATFRLWTRDGSHYDLGSDGTIIYDGSRHMTFDGPGLWRVLGVTMRHHSNRVIPLEEAARKGYDIGQGWVHDLDHGTHRMWSHPTTRRATKVERLA